MSAEVELVKKLVSSDLMVAAVEIPSNHKSKPLVVDDLEEVLARFDYQLARNIYQVLIRKGTTIPKGLAGLARTYDKEGDAEKAIRCYQEAIAYSSEYPFYQALAALQIRAGSDDQAAQTLLHALGLAALDDEQRFDLHKSLGNSYTRLGEYAKAEHHYRKAYELNSKSDILQVNVGSLALQKSDLEAAQKHFQRALELNPGNDKAISGMGMVYLGKNSLAKAYEHFVKSLRLNLNNLGAIYNLVKCAYELKRFDEASELLRRYIELNPVNTNILYSYAGILYHQGRHEQALAQTRKILEANPAHAGAKELMELAQAKLA
ncbi:MAG: tetratricopeptide repeat protein [Deltaproteobacteria bacterium]|nr:tetratricopeptide repeat protein [Deltaproteobacteria bacterium]